MFGIVTKIKKKAAEDIVLMLMAQKAQYAIKQSRSIKTFEMFHRYQDKINALNDLKETINEKFNL